MTGYANWQSEQAENLRLCGFDSHLGHRQLDPVVQRQRRLGDNQESDGSIPSGITDSKTHWSVGAEAARRFGIAEDWVQFPDGPLTWAARPTGRCLACNQEIGVRFPGRSTALDGLMVQRDDTALAWRKSEFDSRWVH